MSIGSNTPVTAEHRTPWHRRPGATGRILAIGAIAIVVVLAGLGIGLYTQSHRSGEPTLTILTYESLFGGCQSQNLTTLVDAFGAAHHAHVEVDCESGSLASALIAQKGAESADVVVGLDEITAPQAEAAGVLVPYSPPDVRNISPTLVNEISSDGGVVPYEYGYLAVDYTPAFEASSGGHAGNFSLPEIAANGSFAKSLMIEDPASDITGEEFLLSEISFYDTVLHGDWTSFWKASDPNLQVSDSWGDAYTAFTSGPNNPPMLVSYSTDPASVSSGGTPPFNATLYHWNGSTYAWRTVYGVGIVAGTPHLALAQAFERWFLGGSVQSGIPTNEWVYPANETTQIPPFFDWSANASSAVLLNAGIPLSEIPSDLGGWLDQWQAIDDQYGA